ncbi:MAG: excinuclease ABC subunit UvrC, partial [Oscillospiraceae bacterium]
MTDTEYEALVLECSLIKQYSPKYNILLKDDKGYHYIKISDGDFPKITAEMQKNSTSKGTYLGPYTSSFTTRQAVNEANRFFMLPTCKKVFPNEFGKARPCLNFHIKQCMGVCTGKISKESYNETVKQAVDYIKTGSTASIERLTKKMEEAAETLEFETAALLRDRISAIKKASETQKIITEIKDTDVIGTAQNGENTCVSVLIYRQGRLFDKSVFFFDETGTEVLEDFIVQFYRGKEDIPKEIIIETEIQNMEIVEQLLRDNCGHSVNFSVAKRGNPLKLTMLAKNNASEYLSIKSGRTGKEIIALEELSKVLGLEKPPEYIEAYDISNLSSSAMVAGMVVFENGRPLKSAYKKFSIKEISIQNDYACMQEVLERRFKHYFSDENADGDGFSRLPDLILLDGGKGQVGAVEPILRDMGITVPIFGMVKDNKHRTRAIATSGDEIAVSDLKPAFYLLTRIQDEVHRFSVSYQRKKHQKNSYELELTKIKGIGEKKAMKIIGKYKTKSELLKASVEDLA